MKHIQNKKYTVPCLYPSLLERPRINREFDLFSHQNYLYLHGKSGYGKTTAVALWCSTQATPYVWINLDEMDNEPAAFCESLQYSLHIHMKPNISHKQTDKHRFGSPLKELFSWISWMEDSQEFLLILDNLHFLSNPQTLNYLSLILKRIPSSWNVFLISQSPPSPRLLFHPMQIQFTIFDEELLLFRPEETRQLAELHGFVLSPKQIVDIHKATEGWIFAILLTLPPKDDRCLEPKARKQLFMFFEETVWRHLPANLKFFLLRTAFFDKLNPTCCDIMLKRSDSKKLLLTLERLQVFISQKSQDSYVYHPLFKAFLIEQLERTDAQQMRRECMIQADVLEALHPYRSIYFYIKGGGYLKLLELTLSYPCWLLNHSIDKTAFITLSRENCPPLLLPIILLSYYEGNIKEGIQWMEEFESRMITAELWPSYSLKIFYLYVFVKINNPNYTAINILEILQKLKKGSLPSFPYAYTLFTQGMTSLFNGPMDFSSILLDLPGFQKQLSLISHQIFGPYNRIFELLLFSEASIERNDLSAAYEKLEQAQDLCVNYYKTEPYTIITCRLAMVQYFSNQKKKHLKQWHN